MGTTVNKLPYIVALCSAIAFNGCSGGSSSSDINQPPVNTDFQKSLTGEELFVRDFKANEGLGPHFNASSCLDCHGAPTIGGHGEGVATHVINHGHIDPSTRNFTDLIAMNFGPAQRANSIQDFGGFCEVPLLRPSEANSFSLRTSPTLFGLGLVAKIPDEAILAHAIDKGNGIFGKPNMVRDAQGNLKLGRFGWKAQIIELSTMVAGAFKDEMGLTNSFNPQDNFPLNTPNIEACDGYNPDTIEISDESIEKVSNFIATLPTHSSVAPDESDEGYVLFEQTLCAKCHVPGFEVEGEKHYFYSDFLLHNMGTDLDDAFVQGAAKGFDWRTTPLHGLGVRTAFIHDARATTINEAILEHGGEALNSRLLYQALSEEEKTKLLNFLETL